VDKTVKDWTIDSVGSSVKNKQKTVRQCAYANIMFDTMISEVGVNNFKADENDFNFLQTNSELAIAGKNRNESIVSNIFSICRNYLSGGGMAMAFSSDAKLIEKQ